MFLTEVVVELRRHIAWSWPAFNLFAANGALKRKGVDIHNLQMRLVAGNHSCKSETAPNPEA